jgi:hypothetical protein
MQEKPVVYIVVVVSLSQEGMSATVYHCPIISQGGSAGREHEKSLKNAFLSVGVDSMMRRLNGVRKEMRRGGRGGL